MCLLAGLTAPAQILDDFTDGDYSHNPAWSGTPGAWVVNADRQLQSAWQQPNSSFWISTPQQSGGALIWECSIELRFNSSSLNYVDVYLAASDSDLSATGISGYLIRLGGSADDICLYRKDPSGNLTRLIDGSDGLLNHSLNQVRIQVICNRNRQFSLSRDDSGTGSNWIQEGLAVDTIYPLNGYFGMIVRQSTASFFAGHVFDDVEVKPFVPDTIPPSLAAITALSDTGIELHFNEPIDTFSVRDPNQYILDSVGVQINRIETSTTDARRIQVYFDGSFGDGHERVIRLLAVRDRAGNIQPEARAVFSWYNPMRNDVVVNEIMADPSPAVGLPELEWVELYNRSAYPVHLKGWRLGDVTGWSAPFPDILLPPNNYLVVGGSGLLSEFTGTISVLALSGFPSLDNDGDWIQLQQENGRLMHAVHYSADWHDSPVKRTGGWSLEQIDANRPCLFSGNWESSEATTGGTPGLPNSIQGTIEDQRPPEIQRVYCRAPDELVLVVNEPLDSFVSAQSHLYAVSNGIGTPLQVRVERPEMNRVWLKLHTPLDSNLFYSIEAGGLKDCHQQVQTQVIQLQVGLPVKPNPGAVCINEFMVDPPLNGCDFIELKNTGTKVIDLKDLLLANRNSRGDPSGFVPVQSESYLLFPGALAVVSTDPDWVCHNYTCFHPEGNLLVPSLPSFNNDSGRVLCLRADGLLLDEVPYRSEWHDPFLVRTEGVSLERIRDTGNSRDPSNWHSASSSSGYATPTAANSQHLAPVHSEAFISLQPGTISPNLDGTDDFLLIHYQFPEPGNLISIQIFDASGRLVRTLQQNALCGTRGFFQWDGTGNQNQRLQAGIYIVQASYFNSTGKKGQFKKAVVLVQ